MNLSTTNSRSEGQTVKDDAAGFNAVFSTSVHTTVYNNRLYFMTAGNQNCSSTNTHSNLTSVSMRSTQSTSSGRTAAQRSPLTLAVVQYCVSKLLSLHFKVSLETVEQNPK